jgi:hypothetical protein|tara:strand:+ start:1030 stop:1584 length:555 start_codon:yes stop_codon:yes gene_type:complete
MYTFTDNSILEGDRIVMHRWETKVMEHMADWVCSNGGDILEIGFGMGIASDFIQDNEIKSHTICDNNPDVIRRLEKWSSDKPNVKIIRGDWYRNIHLMDKYDGILFDTFDDVNIYRWKEDIVYRLSKRDTKYCIWDNVESKRAPYKNYKTKKILVNKSNKDSWNYHTNNFVYIHKITINGEDKC